MGFALWGVNNGDPNIDKNLKGYSINSEKFGVIVPFKSSFWFFRNPVMNSIIIVLLFVCVWLGFKMIIEPKLHPNELDQRVFSAFDRYR